MHATNPSHSADLAGTTPNAHRLLWAGFMAILAAGVGFAIHGGILDNWREEFGFSAMQVGQITGGGLTGFCFGIILGGLIVDKIGYGKLVALALVGHILSAVVTLSASSADTAYQFLFWGSFIFAFANGTLEAVANPLVATVFPHNRTHYLNILHASWPAGMVLGAMVGWFLDDRLGIHWKWQLALYLIPTALYALMFLGQKFPRSEAAEKGASFVDMFRSVGILGSAVACYLLALFFGDILRAFIPEQAAVAGYALGGLLLLAVAMMTKFSIGSLMLFILFVTHALVGAVELGTDSWIQNITGNLFSSQQGKALFIWTSTIMFFLRFCAHFIETRLRLSPIGLLLVSSILAFVGLRYASGRRCSPSWATASRRPGRSRCRSWGASGCSPPASSAARGSATVKTALPARRSGKVIRRSMPNSRRSGRVASSTCRARKPSGSTARRSRRPARPAPTRRPRSSSPCRPIRPATARR